MRLLARLIAFVGLACTTGAVSASAQSITKGAIRGSVLAVDGPGVEGAVVLIRSAATGYVVEARVSRGRFLVSGLEPGGPYYVEVRRLGYRAQRSAALMVSLGETIDAHFALEPSPATLEAVEVNTQPLFRTGGGAATTVWDELIRSLPALNRNFYDFMTLAPQVSAKVGSGRSGISGAGANLRFNSFLVNGADERFVNGSVSPANSGGRSIPLDAVQEYQVLIAPADVRYGGFAGAQINTVTRSGTNQFSGSTFAHWRNDRLSVGESPGAYDRWQYGLSLGGPLVRNRLHFFLATELQALSEPARGPYFGQPSSAATPIPVVQSDVDRFQDLLRDRYGLSSGSAGSVRNSTPLFNLVARADANLPTSSTRLTGTFSMSRTRADVFSRAAADSFPLSSYRLTANIGLAMAAISAHTDFSRRLGGHNEMSVSLSSDWSDNIPDVRQPLVRVLVPGALGGSVALSAGSAESAQGRFGHGHAFKIRDDVTLPFGARHLLVLGAQLERFNILRGGVQNGYGVWTFSGLDALEEGLANRYELRKDFGSASAPLRGRESAAYASDEWRATDRLAITLGLRADRLVIDSAAPYNQEIDSIFHRRTDRMPSGRVYLSPRLGFTAQLSRVHVNRLRGSFGLFTGRPPLAWYVPALANHGESIGVLSCGLLPTDAGLPPAFVPNYLAAPTQCASGPPVQARRSGDVDMLDPNLRLAQSLRSSLAWDREVRSGIMFTSEGVYTRERSGFVWANLNLGDPQAVDRHGRVLYGTIATTGVPQPVLRSRFAEVIDLKNTSKNYAYQLSSRLERRVTSGLGGVIAYTFSRTRDVQSPSRINQAGIALWADARAVSGRHDDLFLSPSLNDLPHRVVTGLTWRSAASRWPTEVALYYVGESGSPFTYLATGASRRGDLNADGSNANDPIYVPRDATDPAEIQFSPYTPVANAGTVPATVTAEQQATALEMLIRQTPCLQAQRGRILSRNSCREPASHTTTASIRQGIPVAGRTLELEVDAFNLLNILNRAWGQYRIASPRLVEHVGQTGSNASTSQSIFRYDPARPAWEVLANESASTLQVALRYRF